ncbi:hypothetical protein, partial [Bradyrhizobium sp. LMTR 3]|uniref:hypothetical protein n=1 Tax=Bradyrhizobium sp. LMTR 3 TaxID=189873 RepID=UPI001AECB72E
FSAAVAPARALVAGASRGTPSPHPQRPARHKTGAEQAAIGETIRVTEPFGGDPFDLSLESRAGSYAASHGVFSS